MKQDKAAESLFSATQTEDEKHEKKQKIVRNEFKLVGKYGMPHVRKQNIDLSKIEPWGYTKAKPDDEEEAEFLIDER